MKREIKFRAWNTVTEKMMLWDDIKKFGNLNKLISLNHVRVQQFTGMVDKNGVEIYEGDIIKSFSGNMEVSFYKGCFYVIDNGEHFLLSTCPTDQIEIIGNTHQNPELL